MTQSPSVSINMEVENLVADEEYILIDLSDTVNWPHDYAGGDIIVQLLEIFLNPDNAFIGDIEFGFIEGVDATDGESYVVHTWHMDKKADIVHESHTFQNFRCNSTRHLSSARNTTDTDWQTDLTYPSPDDPAGATTPAGSGDAYLRVVMSAGSIDISMLIQYFVGD